LFFSFANSVRYEKTLTQNKNNVQRYFSIWSSFFVISIKINGICVAFVEFFERERGKNLAQQSRSASISATDAVLLPL